MAYRLIKLIIPVDTGIDWAEFLGGTDVAYITHNTKENSGSVLNIVVSAEDTEDILDKVEQRFSSVEGFKALVLSIEASLPREKKEPEPAESDPSQQLGKTTRSLRISREELYQDVTESIRTTRTFFLLVMLSSIVASVGLMRNDLAVLIGAMVIAPLLSPNLALAFATTLGDLDLAKRAVKINLFGVAIVLIISYGVGVLFPVNPDIHAIASRTHVSFGDIIIGLAAGSAGTFAYTTGLSGAVIGVMVAVALMPPLVSFGMLVGAGFFQDATGALLLTLTTFVCVNLAGVGTFLAQGVRPRGWWEAEKAKSATRKAITLWIILLGALTVLLYYSN